jgi:hypothetical protein
LVATHRVLEGNEYYQGNGNADLGNTVEPCPNDDEYRYDGECVPMDCINYTMKLADWDLAFSLTNDGTDVIIHIQYDNKSNGG